MDVPIILFMASALTAVACIAVFSYRRECIRLKRQIAGATPFDDLLSCVSESVFCHGPDLRIRYANMTAEKCFASGLSAMIGKTPSELWKGGWVGNYEKTLSQVAASGKSAEMELALHSESETRYQIARLLPRLDAEGGVAGVIAICRDITERRLTEASLAAREREFRVLANMLPVAIAKYDSLGMRTYANPAVERILGHVAPSGGNTKQGETTYLAMIGQVLEKGEAMQAEVPLRIVRGETVWGKVDVVPEIDRSGKVSGVLMAVSDISELKRMELALSLREREFRSLAENMPDNVARWDAEGRYLYINPVHERSLGMPASVMLGKRIREAFPDGRFSPTEEAIRRIVAAGEDVLLLRQPVPDGNGGEYIHDVNLVPERDEEGRIVGVLGIGRDMTEIYRMQHTLAKREEEFRALAENSPDVIVRYDMECRRLYANPAWARVNGVPVGAVLGKSPQERSVMAVHFAGKLEEKIREVAASAQPGELEIAWPEAEGGERRFSLQAVPEFDREGRVASVLTVSRDISRIKETEKRLEHSREMLRMLVRRREAENEDARMRMAWGTFDSLGQILMVMRWETELLAREKDSPDGSAARIGALVDKAIKVMREVSYEFRPITLELGIEFALDWLAVEYRKKTGRDCALDISGEGERIDKTIAADIFKIVEEALENAATHAEADSVEVRLDFRDGKCKLEIRDDGRGFDLGSKTEDSLGFLSMKERALHLGGELKIESRPGKGTAVSVEFSGKNALPGS